MQLFYSYSCRHVSHCKIQCVAKTERVSGWHFYPSPETPRTMGSVNKSWQKKAFLPPGLLDTQAMKSLSSPRKVHLMPISEGRYGAIFLEGNSHYRAFPLRQFCPFFRRTSKSLCWLLVAWWYVTHSPLMCQRHEKNVFIALLHDSCISLGSSADLSCQLNAYQL